MTEEEYIIAKMSLEKELKESLKKLAIEYVKKNKKYNVGDIIREPRGFLRIDKVSYSYYLSEVPKIIYTGFELTKKLAPRKDKSMLHTTEESVLELVVKNVPT